MNKLISTVATIAVFGILLSQTAAADDAAEAFRLLDVDSDGFVTLVEAEVNPELVDSFEDGDDNDDGKLDLVEFTKLEVTDE